ncbi:Oxidoreductase, molybdopterin-binding domain-containing protein [Mycena maculata]|uniref:Nitrate reductase [NADPH] n=1 Tax=Mycena maculata TaxID=230809 RepID=A0AAD7J2V5_9AGAR|nr:Oxidoreductase, molybdopterin-binding domain-containing protein [Mycena maculata]
MSVGSNTEEGVDDGVELLLPLPTQAPSTVLEIDQKTPDMHVCRDPRLIRLTGAHPFNAEAPLTALLDEGFLTSPELFFVRNHGPVPEVLDNEIPDWEFTVSGLVENPMTIRLHELMNKRTYEQHTYPITLVCAGNRRKEQNQVRKSNGFSWGAAGVSTALFTGVLMSDVVRLAGPCRKARYVCMEGADKLPNGHYGTCVKLNWVMDQNKGIMLAYKMNGEMLRPDHGRPLRAVVPGQIGGRSVKWLKKLILTEAPSNNYYHIYDNRVLPTMVSPEVAANEPKWWTDERYAIYDLSPNSVIAKPAHDETVSPVGGPETYRATGYAYGGGGRRITRVDVSLDQGGTWRLADIDYAEDSYRKASRALYGGKLDFQWRDTSFCWCFWALDIPMKDLVDAKDLVVRCMDEGMCVQPRDMYWSVLGMINACWFRVAINIEGDLLRFEHPTQPALIPGGWMEHVKKAGGDLTDGFWGERIAAGGQETTKQATRLVKEISMKKEGLDRKIAIDELRNHSGVKSPWFVVDGEVYDGTKFLQEHPGGAQSIIGAAATDTTDEFVAIHSETAKAMMPSYHIGTLDTVAKAVLAMGAASQGNAEESRREVFLQSKIWSTARLHAKNNVSWDTRVFTYKLDHDDQSLGLHTGQHLMMRLRDPVTREAIVRCYTPISEIDKKGYVDVLVKVYFADKTRKGGAMSTAMDSLPLGHTVDMKGPIGKFEYHGCGEYSLNGAKKHAKRFVMICAGSGVTPIYQVFRAIMRDQRDPTTCIILDSNRLDDDILCRESLDALVSEGRGRGRLICTLTNGSDRWKGMRGRISGEMVAQICPRSAETVVLVCGPEDMEKSLRVSLEDNGWKKEQVIFF